MTVAVVIVSFNTCRLVRACLDSVLASEAEEVVVVDNASADGTVEMVREHFPGVTVLANAINTGYGAAANQGVAACSAPHVVILNGDTRLEPGACDRLGAYLRGHPDVALVGPRLLNPDGTLQPSCFPFPGSLRWLLENRPVSGIAGRVPSLRRRLFQFAPPTAPQAVPWVLGAAFAMRREAYEGVGGFDESYYMYFEEVDLCWRLQERGWEVHLEPAATVVHVGGASTSQRWHEMSLQHYVSTLRFYNRHYAGGQLLVWLFLTRLKMAVRLVRDTSKAYLHADPHQRIVNRERSTVWRRTLFSGSRAGGRSAETGRGARAE